MTDRHPQGFELEADLPIASVPFRIKYEAGL